MANPLSTAALSATQRTTARHRLAVPARLTWKDPTGTVRFISVVTRDVSDGGAFVECASHAPIPLFRLVHLQLETPDAGAPVLGTSRVLAAVWRVQRDPGANGSPAGYALRFLVDPAQQAAPGRFPLADLAVAS